MSWQAQRYQDVDGRLAGDRNQKGNKKQYRLSKAQREARNQPTEHHVPPQSVGAEFTLTRARKYHEAYHLLFGNAATLERCIAILKRDWWTPPEEAAWQQ